MLIEGSNSVVKFYRKGMGMVSGMWDMDERH